MGLSWEAWCSEGIQKNITNVYPEAESKIRVIYRGVDQNLFNKSKIPVSRMVNQLKKMEIQDEKSIILMASRPKLWKGQMILIEALSKVKQDFQCILIGSGDGKPSFQKKLINLITQ